MTTDKTTIQDFLLHLPPFDRIPEEAGTQVAQKLQLRHYSMGQEILVGTVLPTEVTIIYQGSVRLLGYEASSQMPVALKLLESGEILGWVGLLRGVPTETAIASTDVTALTLSAETFVDLLVKYPAIAQYFNRQPTESEVFELFGQYLDRQAKNIPNALELILQACEDAVICNFSAGQTILRSQLDANYLWFVSCGEVVALSPPDNATVHLPLDVSDLRVEGNRPARLLGIPQLPPAEDWGDEGDGGTERRGDGEKIQSKIQQVDWTWRGNLAVPRPQNPKSKIGLSFRPRQTGCGRYVDRLFDDAESILRRSFASGHRFAGVKRSLATTRSPFSLRLRRSYRVDGVKRPTVKRPGEGSNTHSNARPDWLGG